MKKFFWILPLQWRNIGICEFNINALNKVIMSFNKQQLSKDTQNAKKATTNIPKTKPPVVMPFLKKGGMVGGGKKCQDD